MQHLNFNKENIHAFFSQYELFTDEEKLFKLFKFLYYRLPVIAVFVLGWFYPVFETYIEIQDEFFNELPYIAGWVYSGVAQDYLFPNSFWLNLGYNIFILNCTICLIYALACAYKKYTRTVALVGYSAFGLCLLAISKELVTYTTEITQPFNEGAWGVIGYSLLAIIVFYILWWLFTILVHGLAVYNDDSLTYSTKTVSTICLDLANVKYLLTGEMPVKSNFRYIINKEIDNGLQSNGNSNDFNQLMLEAPALIN